MKFDMPHAFPKAAFQEFGEVAATLFPTPLSDQNLNDPLQKRLHFQGAWLAVCYRYRACAEQNTVFNSVFDQAMNNDLWREWSVGEDHNYELEQCLYGFFMNAISVLESFGFCLYFVGAAIDVQNFPKIHTPRGISLKTTRAAFESVFPYSLVTTNLATIVADPAFTRIDTIRNLLAHRLTGRRNVRTVGTTHPDGTHTERREEFWYIPGLNEKVCFDKQLVQRHLSDVTRLLRALTSASLEFVKSQQKLP
ncbi:MAG: hypothetical protein P4L42_00210 [Desulfocapsaceae bacterium]|nr:hypothetical protein [Desulfocapsaceae bacterium]